MTYILCLIAIFSPEPAAAEPEVVEPGLGVAEKQDVTADGVRAVLEETWSLDPQKARRTASSIISRFRRKDADPIDLGFAFGVTLSRHEDWTAADNAFTQVSEKLAGEPRVWLALHHVHSRSGRWNEAIRDLRSAMTADGENEEVARTVAGLVTFFTAKPIKRVRTDDLVSLEKELYPKLNPALQEAYKETRQEMRTYLDSLPKLREDLLLPVDELRKMAEEQRQEAEAVLSRRQVMQAEYESRQLEIGRINTSGAAELAELDRLILRAQQRGDQAAIRAYQAERVLVLEQIDVRVRVAQARQRELEVKVGQMDAQTQAYLAEANVRDAEAKEITDRVEAQLALPPARWDAEIERDRLLTDGRLQLGPNPKPKKQEPPRPRRIVSEDERAQVIMSMARSFLGAEKPDLARKYLERLVKDFPKTEAAKEAAEELERMPKPRKSSKRKS